MITIIGVILMKIFYLFRLWPRGKSFTRTRVNRVYTLSTSVKLLIYLYSLESTIMFLLLLQVRAYGITGLHILMLKSCNLFFHSFCFLLISVILYLVHIVLVVKCISFHFPILNLLNLFTCSTTFPFLPSNGWNFEGSYPLG